MRIEVEGVQFQIGFQYDVIGLGKRARKVTYCRVEALAKDKDRFTASAYFHGMTRFNPHDKAFSKEKGRKLALQKAIQVLPRSTRAKFWDAFWRARDAQHLQGYLSSGHTVSLAASLEQDLIGGHEDVVR